jgi:hypothetical protein
MPFNTMQTRVQAGLEECVLLLTPWKHVADAGESRERLRQSPSSSLLNPRHV